MIEINQSVKIVFFTVLLLILIALAVLFTIIQEPLLTTSMLVFALAIVVCIDKYTNKNQTIKQGRSLLRT